MSNGNSAQAQGGVLAPLLIVFAGPNGSGKSTANAHALKGFEGEYINADDIARSLQGRIPDYRERNIKAAEIAEQRRQQAMRERRSFAFETVMSTPEKVAILTQAKASGYVVLLVFVTTGDPEINVRRVAGRVVMGGHAVEPDAIRRRYHATMALLPCAVEHADIALIVDNSKIVPVEVASKLGGQLRVTTADPPAWLADKLLKPWRQRMHSRARIAQAAPPPAAVQDADASHGKTYAGKVAEATPCHVLQQTGAGRFVIHDRDLSAPKAYRKGQTATIRYAYDKGKIAAP
jgi:predicted ABC-type ATPase